MMLGKFNLWRFLITFLVISVLVLSISSFTQISVASESSYVNSQLQNLRSRLRSLESQVRRLDNSMTRPSPSVPRLERNYPNTVQEEVPDPMFQRLATLVIELKEELRELETRVNQLESQKPTLD